MEWYIPKNHEDPSWEDGVQKLAAAYGVTPQWIDVKTYDSTRPPTFRWGVILPIEKPHAAGVISVRTDRADWHENFVGYGCREYSVEDAAVDLFRFEFGYGGQLYQPLCSPDCIGVKTQVFSKTDTVYFTGNPTDMKVLWAMTLAYCQISAHITGDQMMQMVESALGENASIPLFLAHASPLIIGGGKVTAAMWSLIVDTEAEFEQHKEQILALSQDDLIRIATNTMQNKVEGLEFSVDELIAILPKPK